MVPVRTFDEDTRKYVNHFARDTDDYFAYIFDPESDTENRLILDQNQTSKKSNSIQYMLCWVFVS